MKISVSFLSCKQVLEAIRRINLTDADFIHVDFVDGKFVEGRVIPFRKLKKISKLSTKRLDVHLMTNQLKHYIPKFASLNCEYITFHVEVEKDIEKYIELIHSYGIKAGLALNPETDLEKIKPYLSMVDLILVMSVVPGYGGQSFIPETIDKLKKIKSYLKDDKDQVVLEVDGGINDQTVKELKKIPVDFIVSGSYITSSDNFQERIDSLRS